MKTKITKKIKPPALPSSKQVILKYSQSAKQSLNYQSLETTFGVDIIVDSGTVEQSRVELERYVQFHLRRKMEEQARELTQL